MEVKQKKEMVSRILEERETNDYIKKLNNMDLAELKAELAAVIKAEEQE